MAKRSETGEEILKASTKGFFENGFYVWCQGSQGNP